MDESQKLFWFESVFTIFSSQEPSPPSSVTAEEEDDEGESSAVDSIQIPTETEGITEVQLTNDCPCYRYIVIVLYINFTMKSLLVRTYSRCDSGGGKRTGGNDVGCHDIQSLKLPVLKVQINYDDHFKKFC